MTLVPHEHSTPSLFIPHVSTEFRFSILRVPKKRSIIHRRMHDLREMQLLRLLARDNQGSRFGLKRVT
ncbi:hypothetical protein TcWFU_004564 [Taenia crassiceps]|uniref:Uncharacterized protein n=1 Tax=Taenia crassiceps TaxID=6207 RepID=A0ABR4QDY9_9CEST